MNRPLVRGLALVAVLWIVAALSILVLGMAHTVRSEVRATASQRQALVAATGQGDAALQLVLQELAAQGTGKRPTQQIQVQAQYQGAAIEVAIQPTSGLIDINNAAAPLLSSLFTLAGGVTPAIGAELAQAVLAARASSTAGAARPAPFEAIEDLLRVPGIDYPLYARIAGLITVDGQNSGRVNALAAPAGVLLVLADGNAAQAARIAGERSAGRVGIDTTALNSAYLGSEAADRFRLEARVSLLDGASAVMSRTVDLADGMSDGLPWRTLQTLRWVEMPSNPKN